MPKESRHGSAESQFLRAPAPAKARRKTWLAEAEGVGLAVTLALFGAGAWLYTRRGRSVPEVIPASVSLACPGCGRTLIGGERLAGRRVRCPRCGAVARLPGLGRNGLAPSA